MDTTITVTLVVKGNERRAAQEVSARLNAWFLEDSWPSKGEAPFKDGSLLYWRQGGHVESPSAVPAR